MIKNIDVNLIQQHPDNPRRDLGDLTELADSIKSMGILQNLTVVPEADCFKVIIGHRRLAAAKLAGLTEVPCVVANLSPKEQLATMLLENMQRSDLTVYEQAKGFQMMMDLGESVATIAEKTGMSETTVRKRTKLLELDEQKLKAAEERGATLMDYAKLNDIEDAEERNRVLDFVGTSNFEWKLQNALNTQNSKKIAPLVKEWLSSFATEVTEEKSRKYSFEKFINYSSWKKDTPIPKDSNKKKYYYVADKTSATLYKEQSKVASQKTKMSEKEKEADSLRKEVAKATEQAYELRSAFIRDFTAAKKNASVIMNMLCEMTIMETATYIGTNTSLLCDELQVGNLYAIDPEIVASHVSEKPERIALLTAYMNSGDSKNMGYYNMGYAETKPSYKDNKGLDRLYKHLEKLGYQMSDAEKALQDGTYESLKEEA